VGIFRGKEGGSCCLYLRFLLDGRKDIYIRVKIRRRRQEIRGSRNHHLERKNLRNNK
jgi:hypothetical protein